MPKEYANLFFSLTCVAQTVPVQNARSLVAMLAWTAPGRTQVLQMYNEMLPAPAA